MEMNAVVKHEGEGKKLAPYVEAIEKTRDKFISAAGDLLRYEDESVFAMQALMKNDWSMQVANKNPSSVQLAMRNVAATGLTLNPAHAYAYLVPRDGAIVLDISYKGLIKIATDSGAVLWARADVVYSADKFRYRGPAAIPEHEADVFHKERGTVVGAYCVAKTRDGDVLTEILPIEEIEKIRGKSDLYAKKKSGPWVEWFTQMAKKAVIKRASKTWPYTGHSGKLFEAIELANASEGGYTLETEETPPPLTGTPRGGVLESLDQETQERMREIAATVREYFDADDLPGAMDFIDRKDLGAEERVAMEGMLTSAMRSALKVGFATRKQMAGAQ
jgi:recombination protein RecT